MIKRIGVNWGWSPERGRKTPEIWGQSPNRKRSPRLNGGGIWGEGSVSPSQENLENSYLKPCNLVYSSTFQANIHLFPVADRGICRKWRHTTFRSQPNSAIYVFENVVNSPFGFRAKPQLSPNRLRLNADKTQFIWLGTSHFLDVLQVNSIPANDVVNNLGVYFDPGLLMERQVNKLCHVCYFHLRRLRTVRRSLTKESLLTLVHAFVTSRVDHCNGVLYGSSDKWISSRPTSVCPELGCEADLGCFQVWQHFSRHPWRTSHVADQETYPVQDCSSRATLHRRCSARLLDRTLSSGEFFLWSVESTFRLSWWSRCSAVSTSKIWLQGFRCLWATYVEPASDRN